MCLVRAFSHGSILPADLELDAQQLLSFLDFAPLLGLVTHFHGWCMSSARYQFRAFGRLSFLCRVKRDEVRDIPSETDFGRHILFPILFS